METLLPAEAFNDRTAVLALDVDGPLSPRDPDQGSARSYATTAHGDSFLINHNPDVIAELDRICRDNNIAIGWLTQWGPNVRALVEQVFDGKLAGGFVLGKIPRRRRGAVPADWKYRALEKHVAATGHAWVWVEDDSIDMAVADGLLVKNHGDAIISGVPGLLIPASRDLGLNFTDLGILDRWARAQSR